MNSFSNDHLSIHRKYFNQTEVNTEVTFLTFLCKSYLSGSAWRISENSYHCHEYCWNDKKIVVFHFNKSFGDLTFTFGWADHQRVEEKEDWNALSNHFVCCSCHSDLIIHKLEYLRNQSWFDKKVPKEYCCTTKFIQFFFI